MLFNYYRYDENGNPVDIRLVDNQINRVASPGLDLSYLLYSSVNGPLRRKFLDIFLSTYQTSYSNVLAGLGELPGYSFSQLKEEYVKKLGFGMTIGLAFGSTNLAEGDEVFDIMEEDIDKAMSSFQENNKKLMNKNPLMKPRFLDIVNEMVDYKII